jgi:major membrane immunogen (membrane-anchored lipoprotein)
MTRKPIYHTLDELINKEWKTFLTVKVKGGKVVFRGFKGRYRLSWRDKEGKACSAFAEVR